MKVLLAVTSLMGAGHLQRTLILARALAAAGAAPLVVSGGRDVAHLDTGGAALATLPPLMSDGVDYARLLTPDGEADAAYMKLRADRLVALARDFAPDAVVTELFPFGRRALSGEYLALLEATRGKARIHASIRDVLEPKRKPKRAEETLARLNAFYDGVLVHGDEALTPLALTWPLADRIAALTRYTGYVAEPSPPPEPDSVGEVLVAVGGGAIGRTLLETAVDAARRGARRWRLRVGGADAASHARALAARAGGAPVVVEPAAPDYRARLAAAACSVSLLGYNTATDLLGVDTPAVISPMAEGDEKEQLIRADAFARLPGFTRLDAPTPSALSAAVEAAIAAGRRPPAGVALDGARAAARIILSSA